MDLLTQLNNAVQYIEENICDDIVLEKVSSATNYSSYHFGRLFYYITDMPLSEYIRRRKLSLAAMELQNGRIKIIDLAVKYGYDSADSFTRAFVKQHGITPTEARRSGVILKLFPPITFQIKIQGVHEMNWRIEEKEAFEMLGIEKIFRNDGPNGDFWEECRIDGSRIALFKQAEERHNNQNQDYGISGYYDSGENTYPYMICIRNEEGFDTKGYKIVQIPKLTWAIFHVNVKDHGNNNCKIGELWEQATSWLTSSEYKRTSGPDVECYGKSYEEFWIPVVKK